MAPPLDWFRLPWCTVAAVGEICCCHAQVPQAGHFPSCCLVLRGCQRCLFVVPRPGTFQGDELTRLEAEAAANPSVKGQLLRHVHVSSPCCIGLTNLSVCVLRCSMQPPAATLKVLNQGFVPFLFARRHAIVL